MGLALAPFALERLQKPTLCEVCRGVRPAEKEKEFGKLYPRGRTFVVSPGLRERGGVETLVGVYSREASRAGLFTVSLLITLSPQEGSVGKSNNTSYMPRGTAIRRE